MSDARLQVRYDDFLRLAEEVRALRVDGCNNQPLQAVQLERIEQDVIHLSDRITILEQGRGVLNMQNERRLTEIETQQKEQQKMLYKMTGAFTAIVTLVTLLAKWL